MKNKLLLLLLFTAAQFYAQTGIKLYNLANSAPIAAGEVIQMISLPEADTQFGIDIENTSGATQKYVVKRYDLMLSAGASGHFCFGGGCYGAATNVSPDTLTLNHLQKTSHLDTVIANTSLDAVLTETASTVGKSIVRYTVMNIVNKTDSVQIVFSYNGAVGLKEQGTSKVHVVSLFPNPAREGTTLKLSAVKSENVLLNVYNLLGEVVYTGKVAVNPGENEIRLEVKNYLSGVYFVSVLNGSTATTKRLVVN